MAEKKRGRPEGAIGPTRRRNAGLAAEARERMPPALFLEYYLARMQGLDAVLIPDERCTATGGFRVEHRQGGQAPNGAERDKIMMHAQTMAYGLPAQQIVLDGIIKQQHSMASGVDDRALDGLDATAQAELRQTIERLMLQGGQEPSASEGDAEPSIEDAEWSVVEDDQGDAEPSAEGGGEPSIEGDG